MTTTPPDAPSGPGGPGGPGEPTGSGEPGGHEQSGPTAPGPRTNQEELRDLGRIRRVVGPDRKVAGVAGGLARHLDIDPVIVRVALVVLVFFGGAGLLLYGACWLLLPEDGASEGTIHLDDRNRSIALAVVGGVAALALLGDSIGQFHFPWPLAVIGLLALVVLTRVDRRDRPRPTYPPVPYRAEGTAGGPYPSASVTAPPATPTAGPPTPVSWPQPPPAPSRRRGPILFWFTLALIALGIGVLGILDLAGAPVPDPAYAALAVGVSGAMLVLGSFWGRAGGLILVGLVSTVALAGSLIAQEWEGTRLNQTPTSAAAVSSTYEISAGEIVLDLSEVRDLDALDGRTIDLRADVGKIEVIVPVGLDVDAAARVDAVGNTILFDEEHGGFDITAGGTHDSGLVAPVLSIDAHVSVGEIEIHTERHLFEGTTQP